MARRIRERAERLGITPMILADDIHVKRSSMSNYWSGKRPYPLEAIPRLARRLSTNVDAILTGHDPAAGAVVSVDEAAFVVLPKYDLATLAGATKGETIETVPIRRDWLARRVVGATGLWLTELPADNQALGFTEGDVVICSDIGGGVVQDGWVCIFKSDGLGLFVARYAFREGGEGDVTPTFVAMNEVMPIARIHARLLARV